jgi:hypothetical protein
MPQTITTEIGSVGSDGRIKETHEMADPSPTPLSTTATSTPGGTEPQPHQQQQVRLKVDTSHLQSSYCNVCNASSTREEVVLNFGVNHDWDRQSGVEVKMLHRIILSPNAAKRVSKLLDSLLKEYEARHGELK